ncbi:Rv1733c family protein [Mycolicibacterium vaccae]|uniref:Rv1733c family protein n=1 Tax=Mycolicibacterium vaccae TaxID=1810 RepID=UPI003CE9C30D
MRSDGARDQREASWSPPAHAEPTTFTLGWPRWPLLTRLRGRDPLVRGIDRIEAAVLALVLALTLVTVPVIGAVGTAVYDSRQDRYAQEAATVSQVEATVGAVPDRSDLPPRTSVVTVPARWTVGGVEHAGEVRASSSTQSGDVVTVWVTEDGEQAKAPGTTSHAAVEAVTISVVILVLTLVAAGGVGVVTRLVCNRRRFGRWDRALRGLDTAER